ncbi:putative addiction module killer protein [Bifidobacterium saguini DSM 23967]|nr:putative addiction module killer protein [Bifidobacterium saguini DSM 23967]
MRYYPEIPLKLCNPPLLVLMYSMGYSNGMEIKQSNEFAKWFRKLKNHEAKAAIQARLDACRLAGRPLGDIKPTGGAVSEMRFHLGAGYRVYFTMRGNVLMLLLAGGDKSTQQVDIKRAHDILNDYKEQQ